jgi:hypothetical protein
MATTIDLDKLARPSSKKNNKRKLKQLQRTLPYAANRKAFKKFERRRDVSQFYGLRWQLDLAELGGGTKTFNEPSARKRPKMMAHLAVDLFSKKLWAFAVTTKEGSDTVAALQYFFSTLKSPYPKRPLQIEMDKGGEYTNKTVKSFLKEEDIRAVYVKSIHKNEVVERAIRSFKTIAVTYIETHPSEFDLLTPEGRRMWSRRWARLVRRIARAMNDRVNRSIGVAPSEVPENQEAVQDKIIDSMRIGTVAQYMARKKAFGSQKGLKDGTKYFRRGQWVLVKHDKTDFEKETVRNYNYKPWQIISAAFGRQPFLYLLRDEWGKPARRRYYGRELLPLESKQFKGQRPLAGILAKSVDRNKKRWRARFVDYGPEGDSWISAERRGIPPPSKRGQVPRGSEAIKSARDRPRRLDKANIESARAQPAASLTTQTA